MTEDERRELIQIVEQLRTIKTGLSKYAAGERELPIETLAVDLGTSLIVKLLVASIEAFEMWMNVHFVSIRSATKDN